MDELLKTNLTNIKIHDVDMWKIVDKSVCDHIHTCLLATWRAKKSNKGLFFPGPMAVSVTKINLQNIKNQKYMVCEKSDGERMICYCTRVGDLKIIAFMNRNQDLFIHSVTFSDEVYDGTILDGELVKSDRHGQTLFMVFDCVASCGENLKKETLEKRLTAAHDILSKKYKPSAEKNKLKFHMKQFFPLSAPGALDAAINTMGRHYESDGLIFTPVQLGVVEFTHYTLLKFKTYNTLDFKLIDGAFHLLDDEVHVKFIECTPDQLHINNEKIENGSIVECVHENGKWKPVMTRPDKDTANTTKTFKRTMTTIKDNITVDYIKKLILKE